MNLITAPSCDEHNGKQSDLDERFRNYIAANVGNATPAGHLLLEKTIRSIVRSRKTTQRRPDLAAFEVKIESDAFKPVMERITRGLYWQRYGGHQLRADIELEVGELRIGEWFPEFVADMNRFQIAGDQFFCAYDRMNEHPTISTWVYVFHRHVIGMAFTDVRHPVAQAAAAEAMSIELTN
jgi:hypothetical protein